MDNDRKNLKPERVFDSMHLILVEKFGGRELWQMTVFVYNPCAGLETISHMHS